MFAETLARLYPLSTNYEYAAEIGLNLRGLAPGWWEKFEITHPQTRYPLPQAHGYAFIQWLETEADVDKLQLNELLTTVLQLAEPVLLTEIRAELECQERDYTQLHDSQNVAELFGQAVDLYAPVACLGYPDGMSFALDQWTRAALVGALTRECASRPASTREIGLAHSHFYLQNLLAFAANGGGKLTPETFVTADGERVILAAAGAVLTASRAALSGESEGVPLCLVRPGSHHAAKGRGGGTCLVNNLAIAAADALHSRRARKVAIIDLDAHHGNGTEDIFREDPRVFTLSIHQRSPFFPGTGEADERGRGQGRGYNLNLPVARNDDWLATLEMGLARVRAHRSDLILVEFSTDAHRADPVSDLELTDHDFAEAVHAIELIGSPVVYELGASSSERAWIGGVRALIEASSAHR
jgi:acetoin utilization deacetylase AcuC-like enzyme